MRSPTAFAGAAATGAVQTAIVLAIDTIALLAMAHVSTIVGLGAATVVATVALMSGSIVYQVLLPEIVPRRALGNGRRLSRRDDAGRNDRRPRAGARCCRRAKRCWSTAPASSLSALTLLFVPRFAAVRRDGAPEARASAIAAI